MAENNDPNRNQKKQRSGGGPRLQLYQDVLPGGKVQIQGVVNNPNTPPPKHIVFHFQGVWHERPIESGSAILELPNVPPGKYKVFAVVPEAGDLSAETEVTVPAGREALVADKMIVNSDGKDGHHTVYISVGTEDKKPAPGIRILIKNSSGEQIAAGTTNERGVIDPHPVITPQTPGVHRYKVYAEGTALAPEPLRLDGPPRYPRPPEPPKEIQPEDRASIGWDPFKAIIAGWKAGRRALQAQQEQRRNQQ
jgi:hypothetical protein